MSQEAQNPVDPFDTGQITERLPLAELWEDEVDPTDEPPKQSGDYAA
jgi:hypothetical protein